MYNGIGKKIKGLAKAIAIIETLGAVVGGIAFIADGGSDDELIGTLLILVGPFVAWLSSWLLYGFGELVDKTCDIESLLREKATPAATTPKAAPASANQGLEKPQAEAPAKIISKCGFCEKENVPGEYCKIVDSYGKRYRDLCCDCIEKNKSSVTILK